MKLKEGRIGPAEAAALLSVSLCMNGVFAFDPAHEYEGGNSSYISLPLYVLIALVITLPVIGSVKKTGSRDIAEHIGKLPLGGALKLTLTPLYLLLLLCAARPLSTFAQVLHRLVYDGVSYTSILAFIIPVMAIMAWKGAEALGRTARCIAGALLSAFAVAVVSAVPGFEAYRLFPLLGDGAAHFAGFTASSLIAFLPPMLALTVLGPALQGAVFIKKAAARGALIAAIVVFAAQLAVSLAFTPQELGTMLMPLYRITFLKPNASYMFRLDKLFIMIWLGGCMVSGAFSIYSAALLFARSFGQRDVTPAVLVSCLLVCCLLLLERKLPPEILGKAVGMIEKYGVVSLAPLWISACAPALLKRGKERN